MNRARAIAAWLTETRRLKAFAGWNCIFWLIVQPLANVWYFTRPQDWIGFDGLGALFMTNISVAALWIGSLSWWASMRVEERQVDAEEAAA